MVVGVLAGAFCSGCSFTLSLPPSEPEQRTTRALKGCGSIWYPLADSTSALAGGTWVLYADRKEREEASNPGSTGRRNFTPERVVGYGALAVFGAGALYGFVVQAQCASLRTELKHKRDQPSDGPRRVIPPRSDFPGGVGGFLFDTTPEQARQACVATGREWQSQDPDARCGAAETSATAPDDARLQFCLGALCRITIVYRPPADRFRDSYAELYAKLEATYGEPQLSAATLDSECMASLPACLQAGKVVKGPQWSWSSGQIELRPVWAETGAALELSYAREDPSNH